MTRKKTVHLFYSLKIKFKEVSRKFAFFVKFKEFSRTLKTIYKFKEFSRIPGGVGTLIGTLVAVSLENNIYTIMNNRCRYISQ